MLILGRYKNQRIFVNGDLIINVHEITDKFGDFEVELSFDGPKDKYIVDREEVHKKRLRGAIK